MATLANWHPQKQLELPIKLKECYNLNTINEKTKILLIGDSMLARFNYDMEDSGIGLLPNDIIANIAIGSTKTQHWLNLLNDEQLYKKCVDTNAKIEQIFLMLGTNNLADNKATPELISSAICDIVGILQTKFPEAMIVYVSIMPRFDKDQSIIEKSQKTNGLIGKQDSIQFIDLTNDVGSVNFLLDDKLHFNRIGYEKFASILLKHFIK